MLPPEKVDKLREMLETLKTCECLAPSEEALLQGLGRLAAGNRVKLLFPQEFNLVRGCGHFAGLTLQPGLLEPDAAAQLLSRNGADGVVLTSDIGEGASDLLALPRAAQALRKAGLSDALARRALYEGPLSFLGLTG